jgi:hypothetical protein
VSARGHICSAIDFQVDLSTQTNCAQFQVNQIIKKNNKLLTQMIRQKEAHLSKLKIKQSRIKVEILRYFSQRF